MNSFYNAQISENEISYQPYLYDSLDSYLYIATGLIVLVGGIALSVAKLFSNAEYVAAFLTLILWAQGFYRLLIKNKSKLIFDKREDALYKISSLGKSKLIALSNVYSVITHSENASYVYQLTNKSKPSAKGIDISSFITSKRQESPQVIFFEQELLSQIDAFLNLENRPPVNARVQQTGKIS